MPSFLPKILRDQRGNTLLIAAVVMPLVVGCAGLASDTIQWTMWKRQLQRAADSAAIAGVYNRESASGLTTTTPTAVTHDLGLNLHTWMALTTGYPVVTYPADTRTKDNLVKVSLAVQQPLPFSSMFMSAAPIIVANATAAAIPTGGDACVQALETSGSQTGITNSGNTTIDAPNCVMYSNSPSTNSASAGGSASVNVKAIAAVGGIAQSNSWTVQQYLPYSPPLPDPFSSITPDPTDMRCSASALDANTNIAAAVASGTNCWSSLSVGASKTLNMAGFTGPIYINGGSADLKGTFNCVSCTVVLTNKSTDPNATIGTLSSNAQAANNISAPLTGTFAGLAFYQDRRATGNVNKINGGSSSVISGAVYFPSDILWVNGSGGGTQLCAMIVARRVVFTGNGSLSLKNASDASCAASGLPQNGTVRIIRLVA